MNEPPIPPFDDPNLKAALSRALGREAAPASLRSRIAAGGAVRLRQSPMYRFAAAAIVLIGFAALGYQIWEMNRPTEYDRATAFSSTLYQAMLDTHSARATAAAAGTTDTAATLAASAALARQLNRPVLVADLTKDGWTFKGAGVRNVGPDPAAQLFFTKGKASISVFSMPAKVAPNAHEGETYDATYHDAVIAGVARKGGVYCVVGTSDDHSLSVGDVKSLLQRHQSELTGG